MLARHPDPQRVLAVRQARAEVLEAFSPVRIAPWKSTRFSGPPSTLIAAMPLPVSRTESSAIRVPLKVYVAVLPAWSLQWSSLQKHCVAQPVPEFHVPVYANVPGPLERPSSLIQ